jgi:peptidoglycan/LPS O-acetylase OafA/YrhL
MFAQSENTRRRYELDWLRVFAILSVFIYHCSFIFGPDPSALKNAVTYEFVNDLSDFAGSWVLPLIFIISGASTYFVLGKVSPGKYLQGLVARLLVPLILGIFTHIALQVYLENLYKGTFSGSFFEFYPHYFDGMYAFGGNFAWMGLHLWYLEALFLFSLLCLPLFLWLINSASGRHFLQALGGFLAKPGAAYLFSLPMIVLVSVLDPESWGSTALGGWSIFIYPWFFISGFVIISNERLQESIKSMRWISLAAGILTWPAIYTLWEALGDPSFGTWRYGMGSALYCLSAWCWLLAVFGFGMKHLNRSNPFLTYANEAVLLFFFLHLTIIVILSYFILQWDIPDLLQWLIILIGSFILIMTVYEFLIRRFNVMRFLFGMKLIPRVTAAQPGEIVETLPPA